MYNTEKYLNKCIDSILNQTYSNFELILVNDASTDRCRKICDEYVLKDERVKVIHKNVRGGVVKARNEGLFCSKGTYIYHVDSDDWIRENLLETVYKYIREWNQPDVIMFTVEMVSKRGIRHRPHYLTEGYYDKSRLEKEIYTRMLYDKKLPFLTGAVNGQLWNKVFKRDLFLKHYLKDNILCIFVRNPYIFIIKQTMNL